jgi:hypothetical protein
VRRNVAEITVDKFFEVLQAFYDEPFKELRELVNQWDLKLRVAGKGFYGADSPVYDVGVAIIKAERADSITADNAVVVVPLSKSLQQGNLHTKDKMSIPIWPRSCFGQQTPCLSR